MATMKVYTTDCQNTLLKWKAPESCAPITQIQIQCRTKPSAVGANDGAYQTLPDIYGTHLEWNVNKLFLRKPYELTPHDLDATKPDGLVTGSGDSVDCRVRATNRNGNGAYSDTFSADALK